MRESRSNDTLCDCMYTSQHERRSARRAGCHGFFEQRGSYVSLKAVAEARSTTAKEGGERRTRQRAELVSDAEADAVADDAFRAAAATQHGLRVGGRCECQVNVHECRSRWSRPTALSS